MKDDIKLSLELQRFMDYHSIPNLSELLKIDDEKLLEMDLFGWRLMREVLVLREF
ncbi:hypothetical protein [Flavobacterium sp.]|uniref:hypothetical protein n=1 Tax=Flavobacterium sp. TaxID=239 RepID=UPI003751DFC7